MKNSYPDRLILPLDAWPHADQLAWAVGLKPGDPFDEAGPMAEWSPATINLVSKCYGRWIGWLTTSRLLDAQTAPCNRIKHDHILLYVEHLKNECRDTTVLQRIHGLAQAMRAMFPSEDWSWLYRLVAHLRLNIRSKKDKFSRIRSSSDLHQFGLQLIDGAESYSKLNWKQAVRYRDGLIIGLLSARPLRIRNFASLVIGRHIFEASDGFMLRIPAEEVKTRIELEFELPADLVIPMKHYLEVHRPVLLGDKVSKHLWITKDGIWMRGGSIYQRIVKLTLKEFGASVNPHLFRDCAATTVAIEDPEHVYVASRLLGHGSLETTSRHYNQATSLTAGRAVSNNIQNLRKGLIRDLKAKTKN